MFGNLEIVFLNKVCVYLFLSLYLVISMRLLFIILISTFTFAQQTKFVDFKSVLGRISIDAKEKTISGNLNYDFDVLKPIDTIKIDAQNMTFSN